MKAPGTAYDDPLLGGKDPQPATMDDFVDTDDDDGGVHINSGIPNRAFYLAATAFGGTAWEQAGPIWYATLSDPRLSSTATFAAFAARTVANAADRFDDAAADVVRDAWAEVGIVVR
jgi:Zn-dependent metalloprotease